MAYSEQEKKDIVNKVCDLVMDMNIDKAAKKAGINSQTFYRWIVDNSEFCEKYARAREAISYQVDKELEDICNDIKNNALKPEQARVIIDAKKWLAGKRNAKVYGNKTDVTSGGDKVKGGLTVIVSKEEDKEALEGLEI